MPQGLSTQLALRQWQRAKLARLMASPALGVPEDKPTTTGDRKLMWKQRPANPTSRSGRQAQATVATEGASPGNDDEMGSQDWKVHT